jgi:hypothetical protein
LQDFTYLHAGSVTADQIRVEFTNDGFTALGRDRNVRVDRISIDGTIYESEASTVFSTGTWDNATGCGPGNKQSEFLHCSGYFQYGVPAPLSSTVVVRAAGTTGEELVRLSVDDRPVADYRLTKTMNNFTYRHRGPALQPGQVRIDFLSPGSNAQGAIRKARIDRVTMNGSVYQTEAPQVYSTGTWSTGAGCNPGFKRSEYLQCQGYFQFGAQAPRGAPPEGATVDAKTDEEPAQATPVLELQADLPLGTENATYRSGPTPAPKDPLTAILSPEDGFDASGNLLREPLLPEVGRTGTARYRWPGSPVTDAHAADEQTVALAHGPVASSVVDRVWAHWKRDLEGDDT